MDENIEIQPKKFGVKLSDVEFTQGFWCFDTPGTVNQEQLLDLYTLDELITLVPKSLIMPKTFLVKPGETLLFGGTARIDVVETENGKAVFLTVFCSDKLPLTILSTKNVDEHLRKFRGTKVLAVPIGDEKRLNKFPLLKSKNFQVDANNADEAVIDIGLSTIGWTALSANVGTVNLEVWTPNGRGISTREPLHRFIAKYRANRIAGSSAYKMKPLKFEFEDFTKKRRHFRKNRNFRK